MIYFTMFAVIGVVGVFVAGGLAMLSDDFFIRSAGYAILISISVVTGAGIIIGSGLYLVSML